MIGQTIAHYKVTAKLGAGGMGEVYRATDTKLGREVALKVLPEAFATDAQRMQRFQREAQVLASLNHPNIAAIHGLEHRDNIQALAMELVEGPTLAERIAAGAIPLDETIPLARQMAEALEYAHERGIIHRDLKPANIKVTAEGKVKVLDFGLAKALSDDAASQDVSNSPTLSMAATKAGIILGTAAYMSPEQAKGKALDRRADIWSFGVVLFEMLAGKSVFPGETATDVIAAVVRSEPDWTTLPRNTPESIRKLLRRCLEKDARRRLRDIGEARILLESPADQETSAAQIPERAGGPSRYGWLLGLAGVAAGVLLGVMVMNPKRGASPAIAEPAPHLQSAIELPATAPLGIGSNVPLMGYDSPVLALSRDGRYLAYIGKTSSGAVVNLRDMVSGEVRALAGTEGAFFAFFSPDSQWIGFLTADKVKKVPLGGGSPSTLCEVRIPTLAWWPAQETIYFTEQEAIQVARIPAAGGGRPEVVVEASKAGVRFFTDVLPDGSAFLATRVTGIGGDYGDVVLVTAGSSEPKLLISSGYGGRYVEPGYLLFARAGNLLAVPFSSSDPEVRSEPVLVASGVATESFFAQVHAAHSANGLLAFVDGGDQSIGKLAWVDRKGRTEFLDVPPRLYGVVSLAPDGNRLAVHVADVKEYIWVYDQQRKEGRRLPSAGNAGWPVWSADGHRISGATWENNQSTRTLFVRDLDGEAGQEQKLDFNGIPSAWSSKDNVLAAYSRTGKRRISFFSLGKGEAAPSMDGLFATFSPDGQWLAYASSEKSGGMETFVRSFPDGKIERQVSTEGSSEPFWARSGELFFRKANRWYSTRVATQPELRWDPPRLAFETDFMDTPGPSSAVSADGQRILVVKRAAQPAALTRVNIIVNWQLALQQKSR